MSMLDAFFSKGGFFKTAKCKTLLKLTISRVKLLRNRREMQLKQMRKEIAKLLETGQEATARIRVEHIVREENMMAAQEIIELYCELITVRLPIIETQRECPLDLKEAISSICFAAPRCSDLPELQEARMQFAGKYGKEFVTAASELLPDCGVNRQIVELLSVRAPSVDVKMKLLKEIAEEHNLEWDSSFTETEFRKPHEDLLNGPNQFIGGSTLPFPVEKCDDLLTNTSKKASCKEFELEMKPLPDIDFDFLDLPQVPKVSVIPNHIAASAPDLPNIDAKSSSEDAPPLLNGQTSELDHETAKSDSNIAPHHDPSVQSSMLNTPPSIKPPYTPPTFPAVSQETKQFVHPVSPPPLHTKSLTHEPVHFISHPSPPSEDELKIDMDDVLVAARDAAETAEHAAAVACASASLVQSKMSKDERRVGLDDVLVAAQDAAERARIAAAAARSAASLVQSKMSEFSVKSIGHSFENESEVHVYSSDKTEVLEKQASDQTLFPENSLMIPSPDPPKLEPESPGTLNHQSAHQPSRSPSLEDDPYFSYPNLFGRDSSNFGVDINK